MTIDRMQEAIEARPFRAFKLCFASGTDVLVRRPVLVWIHQKNPRTVVIGLSTGGIRAVDLLLVEALEFEATGGRGGSNGASRRRRSSHPRGY